MTQDTGLGIIATQLAQQVEQRATLGVGTGIGGLAVLVEATLVADADALVVPAGGVRPDLVHRAAAVQRAVAGDVEMVTDIGEASCDVRAAECLDGKIPVVAGGAAMDYQEAHLPVILVETIPLIHAIIHNIQAFSPNTPAIAVATAMMTLRMVPHPDFFSFVGSIDFKFMIYDL